MRTFLYPDKTSDIAAFNPKAYLPLLSRLHYFQRYALYTIYYTIAHELLDGDNIFTGLIKISAFLNRNFESTSFGIAVALPHTRFVGEFEGNRFAEAGAIGKLRMNVGVEILKAVIRGMFYIQ